MSALPSLAPLPALDAAEQFLVGYGKSGAVGVFLAPGPLALRRGTLLGPATLRQARILGAVSAGALLRRATPADERRRAEQAARAEAVFATSQARAQQEGLDIDLLDVDLLFDGQLAVLQYVGTDEALDSLAQALERQLGIAIRLENLAVAPVIEESAHCDKPDCGREGGGCSSCGTGGGCSSCGSAKVELRDYFAHLRTQLEANRTPLL
jgi:hypothetical protein